jgi:pyridoxamine 5'-phosphate oxidase
MNPKGIRFFTNFKSRKGKELLSNPRAAVVFYWPALDRQVRIEGKVELLSPEESDEYWKTRPRDSRIGSAASPQSSVVPDVEVLEEKVNELSLKYEGKDVPRPAHWGGFCLVPNRFEFWVSGLNRLHDRFCYIKKQKIWTQVRLAP